MPRVIFVAGPFRADTPWDQEQNIRRAEAAALEIWKAGAVALCPHAMTRFYQDSAPDSVWLEGTRELLMRCDAAYMMPGWRESAGSRAEHKSAAGTIPILYTMDALRNWLVGARS